MRIDARWEHCVIVDAKFCMFAQVCVLVTGSPVMKDPPTFWALKGLDVVFDIEIDEGIEYLRNQSIVIAWNIVESFKRPIGADEEGVLKGFFRGYTLTRIEGKELQIR